MRAVKFKECNADFGKDQAEYLTLPSHTTHDGTVTTCWKLSFRERIKILITGNIFLQTLTFKDPLQPLKMSVNKPDLI